MILFEVDSFYFKFKNLLVSEKDATLTIKSESGKVQVNLSVELGHVHSEEEKGVHHHSRDAPARKRRCQWRAEARQHAAVETENIAKSDQTDSSENHIVIEEVAVGAKTDESSALKDEFCPDGVYLDTVNEDILIEEFVIKPDGEIDWKSNDIESSIEYKLKVVGVDILNMEILRDDEILITSCLVKIKPIQLNKKERESFPFKKVRWKVTVLPPPHIQVEVFLTHHTVKFT